MALWLLLYAVIGYVLLSYVRRRMTRRSLEDLKGPISSSWLTGNEVEIRHQDQVGDLDFKWIREFGTAWRTAGCLGKEILMLADPKALQYIFHTSGYHYPKRIDASQITKLIIGRGITWAEGDAHQRHRKVMTPAFSAGQLKSFLPLFRRNGAKLSQKWKDSFQSSETEYQTMNVVTQISKVTLDVIGEAAFDYKFGALEDNDTDPLMNSFRNLFADSLLYPPAWDLIFKSLWSYIPLPILQYVEYIPTREYSRFRSFVSLAKGVAKDLFRNKIAGETTEKSSKDVMSILIRSNLTEDPSRRLDEDEVYSQMANVLLAGHDTTSNSLAWLLLELARHPDDQQKLRAEISTARSRILERGDNEFNMTDLDGMVWLNACIKEGLRLNPIIPALARVAARDDVIPLSHPITSRSGKILSEIPVNKGQEILISISGYSRLESVWGKDADKWNPGRFVEMNREGQVGVGVFANLMTFSAGIRGCIGWRFAVIEMQILLAELIESFHFDMPAEDVEIQRVPAGFMIPMVRGKMHEGVQLPLRVSLTE